MAKIIRGGWLLTDAEQAEKGVLRDGAVYIEGGEIIETGDYTSIREKYPEASVIGKNTDFVLPGLIDAHSHGNGLSYLQRGMGYDYLENSLIDWSGSANLNPTLNAKLAAWRHLRSGCTTFHHNQMGRGLEPNFYEKGVDYLTTYLKTGMRVCYSPGIRDENFIAYDDEAFYQTLPTDLQSFTYPYIFYDKVLARKEYFKAFDRIYSEFNQGVIKIFLGPNWAHGASDEYLLEVKEKADSLGGIPIHIHTLQTPLQRAFCLKKYGKSGLKRLDDLGLVNEHLTLGHAVYLTEDDIAILGAKHGNVTSHPTCNLSMRNGIAPVWFLSQAGVNVALGMDEKGFADDEDIIAELRMLFDLHRLNGFDLANTPTFTAYDVLAMGTTNAARSLGLADKVGKLLPGMRADIITVDTTRMFRDPWASPDLDVAKAFIYRAKGEDVTNVLVDGELIYCNGKCLTIDIDHLYEEIRETAARGASDAEREFGKNMRALKPYAQRLYKETLPEFQRDPFYTVNSRH